MIPSYQKCSDDAEQPHITIALHNESARLPPKPDLDMLALETGLARPYLKRAFYRETMLFRLVVETAF